MRAPNALAVPFTGPRVLQAQTLPLQHKEKGSLTHRQELSLLAHARGAGQESVLCAEAASTKLPQSREHCPQKKRPAEKGRMSQSPGCT